MKALERLLSELPKIVALLFVISAAITSLTCVHMLQLASYQTPSYWRWLKRSAGDYYVRQWPLAALAMLGLIEHRFSWAAAGVILIALSFMNKPKRKAKKPLVFTPRIMRLIVVQVAVFSVCAMGIIFLSPYHRFAMVWVAAAYMLAPFVTMLSNWITMPLQRLINLGFLNDARKRLEAMPDLTVIGVTGSYGKTSMKYILARLLAERYETLMTPDSYNTTMGVVRTIRERLAPTHEVFVCEMGARHLGDVREICELVRPKYGVLTSVGEQHLETFGTLENVVKAKYELVDALSGTAFLNFDSEPIRARGRVENCVTYGHDADYTLSGLKASSQGSEFVICAPDGETQKFVTGLLGEHNALNILGAVAVAHTMGIPMERLTRAVKSIPPIPHRLQLITGGDYTVIDDAYNANPNGVKAALETLALFDGTKILVTPGMVELGDRQESCNHEFGLQAAKVCNHVVLVGREQTKPIAKGLEESGFTSVTLTESIEDALKALVTLEGDNKVVLLANDLPDNY